MVSAPEKYTNMQKTGVTTDCDFEFLSILQAKNLLTMGIFCGIIVRTHVIGFKWALLRLIQRIY